MDDQDMGKHDMGSSSGVRVEMDRMEPKGVGWVGTDFKSDTGSMTIMSEKGWLSILGAQWGLLMKKNFLLTARAKKLAFFQFVAPIVFMLILYAVDTYVNEAVKSSPYSAEVHTPTPFLIGGIPRCYPSATNPSAHCYTFAYAPRNNITDELVSRVIISEGIPASEVIGFDTEYDMDDYVLANPNVTQAGYAFKSYEDGVFEYAIMYNETIVCFGDISGTCKIAQEDVAGPMCIAMDKQIIRYQQELQGNPVADDIQYSWSKMQFPQTPTIFYSTIVPVFLLATVMFNFVVLARSMVVEKETRLKEGLRMMGMLEVSYWTSWFAYYTIVMIITVLMLFVAGYIFSFQLFTKNDFWLVFIMIFLFAESMICMGFLLVSIQKRSQSTATIGFIMWVVVCAVFITINDTLYVDTVNFSAQDVVSVISTFAFSKGISDLNTGATDGGMTWSQRGDFVYSKNWSTNKVYGYLVMDSVIYLVLAWYITNVFPGEFGVPRPYYFFLTRSYWVGGKKSSSVTGKVKHLPPIDDEDVVTEDLLVGSDKLPLDTAVVLRNLVKVYGSGKKQFTAVKGISLTMQNNQLFCLLGPNGAGKTTTFSMLTGLFPSSGGDATIFGHSINTEMDKIRKLMGVCPQHDLLWDDLTGRQHLDFFCRFKNVPSNMISSEVKARLAEVGLTKIADVPTSAYSGGEKRRLSVALATCGDPKIVFLDEPTTGMDPVSRHQVWEIISKAKRGRVVILTTHSMEEADRLSDRIGIVAHGQLRCLGTNIHLKNKFGLGYQLNLFFALSRHETISNAITSYISTNHPRWKEHMSHVTSKSPGNITIAIPHEDADDLPDLLRTLEDQSVALEIDEIAINLSSLEEVFLKIAGESLNETSISLSDLDTADAELAQIVKNKKDFDQETPYGKQLKAVFLKTVAHHAHSWRSILYQFLIPCLLVGVMLAMGAPGEVDYIQNPHPVSLPPLFYRFDPLPPFIFPYYSPATAPDLGTCCGDPTGFLGNVTLSVLNSTEPDAISLGTIVPTYAFTFQGYTDKQAMFDYLYNTYKMGWIAAYIFDEFDLDANHYKLSIMRNITEVYATVGWMNLISNAILRTTTGQNNSLTVRMKVFPSVLSSTPQYSDSQEATWVVLGGSFYMVAIMSFIVHEKETKLRNLMQMAGMRMSVYWLVMFFVSVVIYMVFMMFFLALSAAALLWFFTINSPAVLSVSYLVFAFNQVGMAFFISTFTSNSHSISLAAYMYIVALVIATSYINPVFADEGVFTSDSVLYGTAVIPHIAFGRITSIMLYYFQPELAGVSWDFMTHHPHLMYMFVILAGMGGVFFILHQYFELIVPQKYGTTLSPVFFLTPSYWRRVFGKKDNTRYEISAPPAEPADVRAERDVANGHANLPLRVPGLTKIFSGGDSGRKVAVNNLSFTVGQCECLGLLGPNGGGKTTLINVLSGLYPASSGAAYVDGYNIRNQLIEAQRFIGVCPQDSVLFLELTGREHLELFGRLRNLQGKALKESVDLALKQVLLTDAQHRAAGGYSGGMKRRLSLAIALVGNPKIVMLDEPTTGVDPFSRRVVWDVIQSYKKYSSIILITHSMEEAEVLCDRVCMIAEGEMRCIGRPVELKTRYGVGYNLSILHQGGSSEALIQFVKSVVPDSQVLEVMANTCVFSLAKGSVRLSELFSAIQTNKSRLKITDWGLLQSNLEDVLLQATQTAAGGGPKHAS